MNEQIFAVITYGLILNIIMWAYGVWVGFEWVEFFKDNYLLPLVLFISGVIAGQAYGETFGSSLLIGFTLALLISLLFGLRFHAEHTLYKTKPSLNLRSIFNPSSSSQS